jgi:DNA-binding Lrp family transcriptional regulator
MKKLGARFAAAVAARAGQTSAAIAIALGVSKEAVRRQVKRNAREQPPEPR